MIKKNCLLILLLLFCLVGAVTPVHGKGIVYLQNIRYFTYNDYTRVVLDLSDSIRVTEKVLPGKDKTRLYFDMDNILLARQYPHAGKGELVVKAKHLQKIRLAQKGELKLRIVFDFDTIHHHTKFYLTSPYRIVFDVYQGNGHFPNKTGTGAEAGKGKNNTTRVNPANGKVNGKSDGKTGGKTDGKTVGGTSTEPGVIGKPPKKVGKDYSLVRQLGLGVRTIILDPGHGGKDPGTSNRKLKLKEKDLTLDIAKRLKRIFKQLNPQYKVILTRETDRYISLEERTAFANSQKGDLFVSIHLNSAPRRSARGVETYYLSMTSDPWAMQVAAQENAVSRKSIGEMNAIVEQIVQHARLSESRIFTGCIQRRLVKRLRKNYRGIHDLGVKKAPFFVLAGARMPATLAEVSFLSHSKEGKRLKSPQYRYALAAGLYWGILDYIESLGKN